MKNMIKNLLLIPFRSIIVLKKELDHLGAPIITEQGHAVMQDPEKMNEVHEAVKKHNASGDRSGIIVVDFD